jgi:hypothetical protein
MPGEPIQATPLKQKKKIFVDEGHSARSIGLDPNKIK